MAALAFCWDHSTGVAVVETFTIRLDEVSKV